MQTIGSKTVWKAQTGKPLYSLTSTLTNTFETLFKTVFRSFLAKSRHILHFPRFPHFPREIRIQTRIPAGNEKCGKLTTLIAGMLTYFIPETGNAQLPQNFEEKSENK